jgi:hypothetical protein
MFKHGFPPEWSTIKKLIWIVGSGIAGAASGIWKTVSGSLIHITDALASPMQKCEVTLEPIQAGSGDPSPTNVRPITGWTGCEVWVKDEYDTTLPPTLSVTFPDSTGTVYGGTLDVTTGLLTVTMAEVDLGTLAWLYSAPIFYTLVSDSNPPTLGTQLGNIISSQYKVVSRSAMAHDGEISLSTNKYVNLIDSRYSSIAEFKTAMSGVQLVYELAEPIEIQLTPQEIRTLKGENNVWGDGDIELTYKAQA